MSPVVTVDRRAIICHARIRLGVAFVVVVVVAVLVC